VLILLLEPPHRIFTAWTGVSPDRRPAWLALGLFLAFAVVLVIPTTRTYFGLTAPDPPVVQIPAVALVLWFVTLSLALRYRVMERVLGLQPSPTTASPPALTPTEHNRAQARAPRADQLRNREGQAP
jgi:cation-transporting ATPase E